MKIQLRRPSDGVSSEPLEFEMLPLNEGRRGFWHIQRELKKRSAETDLFQQLLDIDSDEKCKIVNVDSVNSLSSSHEENNDAIIVLDTPVDDNAKPIVDDKTLSWLENAEFVIDGNNNENNQNLINQSNDDKALDDLLEQVAELDSIYQDHQMRECLIVECENQTPKTNDQMEVDDNFDDSATYTSLQKAFKHPVSITDGPPIPPKPGHISSGTAFDLILPPIVINPATPDIMTIKREGFEEDEKLPPLPPKRAKKIPESSNGDKENKVENQDELSTNLVRNNSTRSLTPRPQSQIVIKSADLRRSPSKLPPKPTKTISASTGTLPKAKKPGLFSKIFGRKKSKSDIDSSINDSEGRNDEIDSENPSLNQFNMANDPNRGSVRSAKSLKPSSQSTKQKTGKPVGRSVSSVSGKRPQITADIIHIPLKGDSSNSLPLRESGSGTHLSLPGNDFYERASTASLHPIDRKTMSALQLADVPIQDGDMNLVAIADAQSLRNLCEGEYGITLDPSVDLTEAEHYALYTSFAPHATASEFDENSCYYAPVEGGEILTPSEVAKRLAENL